MNNYQIFIAQKQNNLNIFKTYDFYPDNLPVKNIKELIGQFIEHAKQIGEKTLYKNIFAVFTEDEKYTPKSYIQGI